MDADRFLERLVSDARRTPGETRRNRRLPEDATGDAEAWLDTFDVDPTMRSIEGAGIPEPPPESEPAAEDARKPPPAPPPRPAAEWEELDTDELLRRYERGGPPDDGTT